MSDADMTWRRTDGTTGEYRGELFDLGMGIPRALPSHGIRRAIFDLAFGYVSGFPVRDIIPFAVRSLFPSRAVLTAEAHEITCDVPPSGWWCSRDVGHDGPCASRPLRDASHPTADDRREAFIPLGHPRSKKIYRETLRRLEGQGEQA